MTRALTGLERSMHAGRRQPVPVAGVLALVLGLLLPLATPAPAQDAAPIEPAPAADDVPSEVAVEPATTAAGSNLVPVESALAHGGVVRVAGTVDRDTVRETEVEGVEGHVFVLVGPTGDSLDVELAGKLPRGFDVALSVVVLGEVRGDRLHATSVLVPGAPEWPDPNRGLKAVLAVNILIWAALFGYVLRLGSKLRRLEAR